ncbi:MAG: hypothetical protein ABIO70_04545 [Pseudomonadota bacterium]
MGFQGSRPSDPAWGDEYFVGNTLLHQGGMVVRRLLAAFTQQNPPTFATWYASMDALTECDMGWDLYSSTGLRNVLIKERTSGTPAAEPAGPLISPRGLFTCGTHAWPRPAWFTLRRLAWLLARAQRPERVYLDPTSGAVLVRLVAAESFYASPPPPPSTHLAALAEPAWVRGIGHSTVTWELTSSPGCNPAST